MIEALASQLFIAVNRNHVYLFMTKKFPRLGPHSHQLTNRKFEF